MWPITVFFQCIAERFAAPIDSGVLNDVEKYANDAIGKFILVVSRKGSEKGAEAIQIRLYRDRQVMVLAISDAQMLEIIERKERGENPEDVLDDLLDKVLMLY